MKRVSIFFLVLIFILDAAVVCAQEEKTDNFGVQRYEQEQKIQVPLNKEGEVWNFMVKRIIDDPSFLKSINPLLSAQGPEEENFIDTYYDTPTLQALAQETGVRYRRRANSTTNAEKESMQIKTSGISDDPALRGDLKFRVEKPAKIINEDDAHPMIGIIKSDERTAFKNSLQKLNLEPYSMKPILNLPDNRKRIYIIYNDEEVPIISISFDHVQARYLWAKSEFVEIEPELRQTVGLNDPNRNFYAQVQTKIVDEIKNQFSLTTDTIPKYNKVFNQFEKQIPFLRMYIKYGGNLIAVFVVILAATGAGIYFLIKELRHQKPPL